MTTQPVRLAQRLYGWMPVLLIGLTLLALVAGTLSIQYIERRMLADAGGTLSLAAANIAEKIDRVLFERRGDAEILARSLPQQWKNRQYLTEYLGWMRREYAPFYDWLGVMDDKGRVIASTNPSDVGRELGASEWFRTVRETKKMHVGDAGPYESTQAGEWVAFTSPLFASDGTFLGVVSTRVGVATLEDILTRTIRTITAQEWFLGAVEYQFLTKEGRAFVDSDLEHNGQANLVALGLPSAGLSEGDAPGFVEEEHARKHIPVVTGYAKTQGFGSFPGLGWRVLVRMDRAAILGPIHTVSRNLALAGVIVWVPTLAVLLWSMVRLRHRWEEVQQERDRAVAAELAERESEARVRLIVDTAMDAVISMDVAGGIVDWNLQAERIFGWARAEVIGRSLSSVIIPERLREAHERGLARFLATGEATLFGKRLELSALHRSGRELLVEFAVSPIRTAQGYSFSAFLRDITEHKRAARRLASQHAVTRVLAESPTLERASAEVLQAICESLEWDMGVYWTIDRKANALRCVEVWVTSGVDAHTFEIESRRRMFAQGVGLPGRVWATGAPVWIVDIVGDENFPREPMAAQVGLHGAAAFPILLSGGVLGVLEFFSRAVRQPDDDALAMMAAIGSQIGQVIERKQLEEQVRQSHKIEAVGRLAGGIAHDFNNLLTVIMGYNQILKEKISQDDPKRRPVEEIGKSAARAAALTSQLLAFSRRQVLAPKVLDMNGVVAGMEDMLHRLLGEDITLVVTLAPRLQLVMADPVQLEQVVLNLSVNARDAMPQGGQLTLLTRNVTIDLATSHVRGGIKPGSYVMLAVTDSGKGMNEETKVRIFEPFYTSKEAGKGTGLGLSMVYGIVKQSEGYIFVDSVPGEGSTFTIYFPPAGVSSKMESMHTPQPLELEGQETILLVEDEPMIRALACDMLRSKGYTVLEAGDGPEAVQLAKQSETPIHLLLTDVVMPGMSGGNLAERLRLLRPALKILFMSGYTDDAIVHHGVKQEGAAFLQKPFTPDGLVVKVREVLDATEAPTLS